MRMKCRFLGPAQDLENQNLSRWERGNNPHWLCRPKFRNPPLFTSEKKSGSMLARGPQQAKVRKRSGNNS